MTDGPGFFDDFKDLLELFTGEGGAFIVVGAHALAAHGIPRATGDLDVWVNPTPANAQLVMAALQKFGASLEAHGVDVADFAQEGTVYQLGLPPKRIDILTSISGIGFDEASRNIHHAHVQGMDIPVLGRESLLKNKRATGRVKDALDVKAIEDQKDN